MLVEIAAAVVVAGLAYYVGTRRGRREEARWWTGAVYAAGRGKLESLQAYIAAQNPRAADPHTCPDELARHLVLPHVSDGGKPIVLPTDWAAPEEKVTTRVSPSGSAAVERAGTPPRDAAVRAATLKERDKAS